MILLRVLKLNSSYGALPAMQFQTNSNTRAKKGKKKTKDVLESKF